MKLSFIMDNNRIKLKYVISVAISNVSHVNTLYNIFIFINIWLVISVCYIDKDEGLRKSLWDYYWRFIILSVSQSVPFFYVVLTSMEFIIFANGMSEAVPKWIQGDRLTIFPEKIHKWSKIKFELNSFPLQAGNNNVMNSCKHYIMNVKLLINSPQKQSQLWWRKWCKRQFLCSVWEVSRLIRKTLVTCIIMLIIANHWKLG